MTERNADRHRAVEHATDADPSAAASRGHRDVAAQIIQDWISQPDYAASDWTTLESRITAALARATAAERERLMYAQIIMPGCDGCEYTHKVLRAGAPAERRPEVTAPPCVALTKGGPVDHRVDMRTGACTCGFYSARP